MEFYSNAVEAAVESLLAAAGLPNRVPFPGGTEVVPEGDKRSPRTTVRWPEGAYVVFEGESEALPIHWVWEVRGSALVVARARWKYLTATGDAPGPLPDREIGQLPERVAPMLPPNALAGVRVVSDDPFANVFQVLDFESSVQEFRQKLVQELLPI